MFKIFPATITHDRQKIPLFAGWQEKATNDPNDHKMWQEVYKDRLKVWGILCGKANNILVLDVDAKDGGYETLKNLNLPVTMSQRTLSGGLHLIFKYPNDGRVYGNRVKFLPGLDIRGEGGWIACYGLDSTPIADAPQFLLDAALRYQTSQVAPGASIKVSPEIAIGIIEKSLESIREAPPGESNNILNVESFRIGQLVASNSVSREYAEKALMDAAIARGKPLYEAKATITSGLDGGMKKPLTSPFGDMPPVPHIEIPLPPVNTRWTPKEFEIEQFMDESKLRKPQLFQSWSTEDITITTADGGTGKTTLKLYEAICLALGMPFLGFACTSPRKTLFITGEDTAEKLASMIGKILREMGMFDGSDYNNERIRTVKQSIIVKKDADLCLIVKDRSGFIHMNKEAMTKLLQAVEDIKPGMIVVDPISSFWGS